MSSYDAYLENLERAKGAALNVEQYGNRIYEELAERNLTQAKNLMDHMDEARRDMQHYHAVAKHYYNEAHEKGENPDD